MNSFHRYGFHGILNFIIYASQYLQWWGQLTQFYKIILSIWIIKIINFKPKPKICWSIQKKLDYITKTELKDFKISNFYNTFHLIFYTMNETRWQGYKFLRFPCLSMIAFFYVINRVKWCEIKSLRTIRQLSYLAY